MTTYYHPVHYQHEELPYSEYIQSPQWRERHSEWLKIAQHRCSLLPWLPIGRQVKGKYRGYNMHHTDYRPGYQNTEVYGDGVVAVSLIGHWIIHRVLGGHKRASKQKMPYPNRAQRIAHAWCRLPLWLKLRVRDAIGLAIGVLLGLVLLVAIRLFFGF